MKIIHAADLHIDSAPRGLPRYPGAPVERLREATREAFKRLVTLAISERAALLLVAGDVFDGSWRDYDTGLFFVSELVRLRASKTKVVLVRGNHDYDHEVLRALELPDHVRVLPSEEPASEVFDDIGVVVHGQSFPTRHVKVDLAAGYPSRIDGLLNIGLLHTSADGRPNHADYAPTKLEVLESKGYDYWALGHVHAREVLSESPWVVFPGNLQGLHAKEIGPKGAMVLSTAGGGVKNVAFEALDVVRWDRVEVDVSGAVDLDDALDALSDRMRDAVERADGRVLAARIELSGRTAFAPDIAKLTAEARRLAMDRHGEEVYVEKVSVRPSIEGLAHLSLFDEPLGAEDTRALLDELDKLKKKLPPELGAQIDWSSEEAQANLLANAEALLRARLTEGK